MSESRLPAWQVPPNIGHTELERILYEIKRRLDFLQHISPWLEVQAAGTSGNIIVFGTGWGLWTSTANETPAYQVEGSKVRLRGLYRRVSGTGIDMFVVPSALRPTRATYRDMVVNGAWGLCQVQTGGNIIWVAGAFATGNYFSIDIEWDIRQP